MSATSSTRARGFALAAARALGAGAPQFCAARGRLLHGDGEALARAAAALNDAAAQARAGETLGRVAPAGLERVDRSWYVAPPNSTSPAAAASLGRAAYARLVPMDDDDARPSLARHSAGDLERAIAALGRRRVALAFVGAPRGGLAQLCARIGEPAASALVAEVRALKNAAHDEIKAAQRAIFSGDDGELGGDGGERAPAISSLYWRVGAAWLAPALARDGDELRRVAQRLPRPLGQALLDAAAAPSTEAERSAAVTQVANLLGPDL